MQGEGTAGLSCHLMLSHSNTAPEKQGDKHRFLQAVSSLRFGNLRHRPLKMQAGAEHTALDGILLSSSSAMFHIEVGAVSIKVAATKAIHFNKPVNISECLCLLQEILLAQAVLKEKLFHLEKPTQKSLQWFLMLNYPFHKEFPASLKLSPPVQQQINIRTPPILVELQQLMLSVQSWLRVPLYQGRLVLFQQILL